MICLDTNIVITAINRGAPQVRKRLVDELAGAWDNLSRIPPAGAPSTQPAAATQPDRPGLSG